MHVDIEKVVATIDTIDTTCFDSLNSQERLVVISNLLLKEAEDYLPDELQKNAVNLLSNGKAIAYELLKYEDNMGLDLAMKAHMILAHTEVSND